VIGISQDVIFPFFLFDGQIAGLEQDPREFNIFNFKLIEHTRIPKVFVISEKKLTLVAKTFDYVLKIDY